MPMPPPYSLCLPTLSHRLCNPRPRVTSVLAYPVARPFVFGAPSSSWTSMVARHPLSDLCPYLLLDPSDLQESLSDCMLVTSGTPGLLDFVSGCSSFSS